MIQKPGLLQEKEKPPPLRLRLNNADEVYSKEDVLFQEVNEDRYQPNFVFSGYKTNSALLSISFYFTTNL